MKRFFKKRYIIIFAVLMIMYFLGPPFLGGNSWSEYSAIRYSYPNMDGKVVFEKEFENKKLIIWDTNHRPYVKLIENKFGFLFRSTNSSVIDAEALNGKMKITWSANQKGDKSYNTIFGAEVYDKDIVKIIVSNERHLNESDLSLSEVKEKSTLFIEMVVENGYAAHYVSLPNSKTGGFVFRGVNSEGNIVSLY
jgi:hypothetical protein